MHFTNSAALWLLLLLPLPLLLTQRRRPVARHVVSNLFLWRAAAGRAGGNLALRRARRTWRVAVQMACIAAIVIGLGGPIVTLGGGRTVFVFDISASMAAREDGAATRFDAARARARAIVGTLPPASRVRLIRAAASPRELGNWAASDPLLASAIDALTPTAGRADIATAIDIARRTGDADTIIVFSDTTLATSGTDGGDTPAVQWVRVGRVADNAAVTRVAARPATLGGRAGQVLVVLRHYGMQPRDADVEISVDGRLAHRAHVRLAPAGPLTLNVTLSDLGHLVTARLVGEDALPLDDVRSVAVPLMDPIRVALFGRRSSFLARALGVNPSVSLRHYDNGASAAEMASVLSRSEVDVLVCDGCMDPVPSVIPTLAVAATDGERVRGLLTLASRTHPLAASLEPGQQTATVLTSAVANAGADVILRVDGIPAVTASDASGRRMVGVHLDLSQPDFVLSPAFPILIANALAWLMAPRDLPGEATAGEPLLFTASSMTQNSVRVVGPDGRVRGVQRVGRALIVADTDAAGAYRVQINGVDRTVIVNPAGDDEANLFAGAGASFDQSEAAPRVSASEPIAVGGWLALAGLAFLALEWRLRMGTAS